jgi:uncharacterized membrane protein YhhN
MTIAALAFWLGCAVSPAYLVLTTRSESLFRSIVKTLPLALFALASHLAGAPPFLTLALVFSALGDLALSRSGRAAFLYGLSAFALAHLMFILLFQALGGVALWQAFAISPLASVVLLAAALSSELWLAPFTGAMRWPVRIYVTLITLMGLSALALPAGHGWVVVGAGLFILSDMILSIRLFRLTPPDRRLVPAARALWIFYILGQVLIVSGLATF